jgi:type II secretory pathway component PulF
MGPFSTAILVACLQAMKYLLWLVAALLVVLVIVQALRGDPMFKYVALGVIAVLAIVGGFVSGRAARYILERARTR